MTFLNAPRRGSMAVASLLAIGLLAVGASGQATTTPTIDKFSHEMTLPITNIGFSGTLAVPPNILESIQGGALEIRQSVEYVRASNLLRVRHFLVAPGSPNPTPAAAQTNVVNNFHIFVRGIEFYENPRAVIFSGTVDRLNVASPFGNITGHSILYSVGYTPATGTATTTELNDITLLIPGLLTAYGQESSGTLTFVGPTTPGEPGTGPKADAGADVTTAQSEISLDGTKSSHSDNDTLTYSWRVVRGSANILNANTATPRVQLAQNFAEYEFELTVTDTKGATSKDTVIVRYSGRF